jgi:hypothetical protein
MLGGLRETSVSTYLHCYKAIIYLRLTSGTEPPRCNKLINTER